MGRLGFEQEIAALEHLAGVNHVNLHLKRMIWKKILKIQPTSLAQSPYYDWELRWIRLPFLRKFSSKIRHILHPFGLKPAFAIFVF